MPVIIRIYGKEATFSQGCWDCEDESIRALLQALADPRAHTPEDEEKHGLYAAGRYGGLILLRGEWQSAPHPEPEIRMEDIAPAGRPEKAGWLSFLRKRS